MVTQPTLPFEEEKEEKEPMKGKEPDMRDKKILVESQEVYCDHCMLALGPGSYAMVTWIPIHTGSDKKRPVGLCLACHKKYREEFPV